MNSVIICSWVAKLFSKQAGGVTLGYASVPYAGLVGGSCVLLHLKASIVIAHANSL